MDKTQGTYDQHGNYSPPALVDHEKWLNLGMGKSKPVNQVSLKKGETPAVYVDVDGTLLIWPVKAGRPPRPGEEGYGLPPKVNTRLVEALRKWHRDGKVLVFWSRGGKKHCEYAAQLCGLKPDACLPKPRIAIDDSPRTVTAGESKGFIIIGPHGDFGELSSL